MNRNIDIKNNFGMNNLLSGNLLSRGVKTAATSVTSAVFARTIRPKDMFRHYKGNVYCVESVSGHTERDEILVNYYDITNPKKIYSRPLLMFNEYVTIDGSDKLRFENFVSNTQNNL